MELCDSHCHLHNFPCRRKISVIEFAQSAVTEIFLLWGKLCKLTSVCGGIGSASIWLFSILRSQLVPTHSELQETRYSSRAECESGCNYLLYHLRCHKEIKRHEMRQQRMWGIFLLCTMKQVNFSSSLQCL